MRPARPEDAAAIAAVHVRTWQTAYEHVFGADRLAVLDEQLPARVERWERILREEDGPVWVAEDEGRIVGFVGWGVSRDEAGEGELYAIYVLPDAWGSGAGPALMAVARERLLATYPVAILWVLDDNPRARRFYEREGWVADGGRKVDTFLGVEVAEVRYCLDAARLP